MRLIAFTTLALALCAPAAEPAATNVPPPHLLLLDSLGRVVRTPTNEVHRSLLPAPSIGLRHQTPNPIEGRSVPDEVLQRMHEGREGREELQFFPAVPPQLMPYLASFDEHGNTALRPGALFSFMPLEPIVQGGKYWLGEAGLGYSLEQGFTGIGLSEVIAKPNCQKHE